MRLENLLSAIVNTVKYIRNGFVSDHTKGRPE